MAENDKIVLVVEAEDNASVKIKAISKNIKELGESGKTANKGVNSGINGMVKSISGGIKKVNDVTRSYNYAMSGVNNSIKRGIRELGSAIYDFTSDAINNFTEFSEQHAKTLGAMQADYDNTAKSQAKFFEDSKKLKDQALSIGMYGIDGTGSLRGATEISELQTELIKAGVSANDITKNNSTVTQDVLRFAEANDLDSETAVSFAVSLGSQFNVAQNKWGEMLDKVSHTADMSIIDVKDIVQSMKYAGGVTSGIGRDLEETLGMVSILGNFGLKGSQSGAGIQALLTRLLTGDTTVITEAQAEAAPPKALKAFYDFSNYAKSSGSKITYDDIKNEKFTEKDITGQLRPMDEVVDQLDEVMGELNDEEQAWFAKKFFGLYQMKSAYALINGDETNLNEVIKEIKTQSNGTNEKKLQQLLDSQYGQLKTLNNLWEGIKTDFGDRLSPFVDKVRDELFAFLQNDGNYDIDFDGLRDALDESADIIEQKYGSAIADAVRGIGGVTIDFTEVFSEIGPELGTGVVDVLNSFLGGDILGGFKNWGEMIDNMEESVQGLPEDLQDLGGAVVSAIDWFGKLVALNTASEIAQLISSVLQKLTIAGGAVINVAGAVVVNGNGRGGTGTGGGAGGATTAGAAGAGGATTAGASAVLKGSTVVGSADDVAKLLGTTAEDVTSAFGKQASYTIDDIARGLGTSTDELINSMSKEFDDLIKAGTISVDEVAKGGSKVFGSLSKFGKTLGVLGTMWQIYSSGKEAYTDFSNGDDRGGAEAISGGLGSLGGAYGGASVGSAFGPYGTVIGAIIGSLGGDKVARDFGGEAYQDIKNEKFNYGNPFGFGDTKWQKQIQSQRNKSDIRPSDYGLPKSFDKKFDPKTGEIYWDSIINSLQNAKDYPLTWGRVENEYGMNVDEAKKWQNSEEYKKYLDAFNGAIESTTKKIEEANNAYEQRMITVKKGDPGYDEKYDTTKQGYYNVWNGTQAGYNEYSKNRGLSFADDSEEHRKKKEIAGATTENPYYISQFSDTVRSAIIDGFNSINKKSDGASSNTGATGIAGAAKALDNNVKRYNTDSTGAVGIAGISKALDNLDIKSNNITLTGDVKMPDVNNVVKSMMPNGWAALSDKGKQDLIQNQIDNNITIDDSVTMTPSFNVSAPNVNVDVKVDQFGGVTKNSTILNKGVGGVLDSWYSRTTSQYGSSTKK